MIEKLASMFYSILSLEEQAEREELVLSWFALAVGLNQAGSLDLLTLMECIHDKYELVRS